MSNQVTKPKPSLSTLCNPLFCDGHATSLPDEKYEELISSLLENSVIVCHYEVAFFFKRKLISGVIKLYGALADENINSTQNLSALQEFREETKLLLSSVLNFSSCEDFKTYFFNYIPKIPVPDISQNVCLREFSTEVLLELNERTSSNVLLKIMIKNKLEVHKITSEMMDLMSTALKSSMIGNFLEFFYKTLSKGRIVQFVNSADHFGLDTSPFADNGFTFRSEGFGTFEISTTPLPFHVALEAFYDAMVTGTYPTFLNFKENKRRADKLAAEKKYYEAIELYETIYFFEQGPDDMRLQALSNCAALRLRLYDRKPREINFAIAECTMALEINPNHVKALFRRGLGLALAKRWNQAIVDFERALELDPNSPAKKELEVARRQVMRRIGN